MFFVFSVLCLVYVIKAVMDVVASVAGSGQQRML